MITEAQATDYVKSYFAAYGETVTIEDVEMNLDGGGALDVFFSRQGEKRTDNFVCWLLEDGTVYGEW